MADAKKNQETSFVPERIVYWRNPRAKEEGQPEWLHGMAAGEQLDGLRVYVFDTEYRDAMDLVLRHVPWTDQPSGTDRFGLDALFELSILTLSEERRKEVAEGECNYPDELRPLDRLSNECVRRLARARTRDYLYPMAYHIYETSSDGCTTDVQVLGRRRLQRFYQVVLPAFIEKAPLADTLELLMDAPDPERGRRRGRAWELIVKYLYWPLISLPQAYRRCYRSLNEECDEVKRTAKIRRLKPASDLLLKMLADLLDKWSGDEVIFEMIDPNTWKRTLWEDLGPHFLSASCLEVTSMLRDHWGMRYFPKLVAALMKGATAERADLVTKTLNTLNTDRTLPRLRSSTQVRLRMLVPEFVICLGP